MPIQTGILPVGSTLTVDYSIGETATISYQDGDIGVVDNGQTKTRGRTIGPFANDVAYSINYTGLPKVFTTAAGGSITTISLPLPDPATLGAGEMVPVTTPYGQNVATVVNGAYRYLMPFVTTWVGRPPASSVPVGTELQVTDYGNQKWVSDGTYWRAAQGRAIIKDLFGLVATGGHIAQISGTTAGLLAIPGGCKIPAGMVIPHSRLYIQADGIKTGGNGTASFIIYLGTTNSVADSLALNQAVSIGSNTNALSTTAARFGTATDRYNSRNWQGEGISSASQISMSDRIGNVNTNADMFVNVGVAAANAADVFNLTALQVVLES